MDKLMPLHDKIIIRAAPKEDKGAFGIILPDAQGGNARQDRGEVIAVGPGRRLEDGSRQTLTVKVGDKVVFKKYASDEVKIGEETLLVVSECDLVALIGD